MNVKELIGWLKDMPEDAQITVLVNGTLRHDVATARLEGNERPVVVIAVRPSST